MTGPRSPLPLAEHCAALAACRRCAGESSVVRPIVPDVREPVAMLVGQAPGQTEAVGGRAFAGRAGRTLFRWLARVGFDEAVWREHVLMAAVTRCYPGPSPSGRGDRVPAPAEIAACAGWLDAELRLVRPPVLVLVGRLAIDRFIGPRALTDVVGQAHRVAHPGGESLAIPLPHPSGASSWVHQAGHGELLDRALERLAGELPELIARSARRSEGRVA